VRDYDLLGRRRIYTNEKEITRDNILDVLNHAKAIHDFNVKEMQFLIEYERGKQDLQRTKTIRPEIDIRVHSNIANDIKEFKVGYNWSNPIMLIQRGDNEIHETDPEKDDKGIAALNEALKNGSNIGYEDQCLAESIEVCGIGHRMIDVKTSEWEDGALFELYTLDSQYAFCVYRNAPGRKKVLGVTFSENGDQTEYTCFTSKLRFEVVGDKVTVSKNPLGRIPIVEYERSFDRTGCFERQISRMDALNILISDFTNDVAQRTQEIWWGDNVDFQRDEKTGEIKHPRSGQWILTYSDDGKVAKIQPLSSTFDGSSTLNAIQSTRSEIFQDCKVPIQYDSAGGGSTGVATDMSSGWSAAELDALKEQQMTERGKREELMLILAAVDKVPENILPMDSPVRQLHSTDIDFHFTRRRNYDLVNKANFVSQMLAKGLNGRHVLKEAEIFPDAEQVWLDSKEMIEAIQKSALPSEAAEEPADTRISADNSDQTENSPILDGMNTEQNKVQT